MLQEQNIRDLVNIKDKNIQILGFKQERVKNRLANILLARLTYTPKACRCCGVKNEGYTIIKHGTKLSKMTWLECGGLPTYIHLKKQRFYCKECGATFSAETPEVKKHCFIANKVKQRICIEGNKELSMKDLAQDCYVSSHTVRRVLRLMAKVYQPSLFSLPKHLMFDEFTAVRNTRGKYSFIYADAQTHEVVDILDSTRKADIKEHFRRYSLSVRNQVKTIVIDMNMGYKKLIQDLFPKASILIDGFHIIQLINRSLNRTRIQVMNQLDRNNPEDQKAYKKLKRYWKLPLKYHYDLNDVDFKSVPCFQKWQTERSIVDTLLSFDDTFKETYSIYQWLLQAYKKKDFAHFKTLVKDNKKNLSLSDPIRTSLHTLDKHLEEIENTLNHPYSNGPLEGINNKIKNIKRTGYGFRNFYSLKARIVLACNIRVA